METSDKGYTYIQQQITARLNLFLNKKNNFNAFTFATSFRDTWLILMYEKIGPYSEIGKNLDKRLLPVRHADLFMMCKKNNWAGQLYSNYSSGLTLVTLNISMYVCTTLLLNSYPVSQQHSILKLVFSS